MNIGGRNGTNLGMAIIREHFARKGLGLHNDLQNEHSIVGNNVGLLLMIAYGTEEQKAEWIDDLLHGRKGFCIRNHRTRTTARMPPTWRPLLCETATSGSLTVRQDMEHRDPFRHLRHDHGAHLRQGRRRGRDHCIFGAYRHAPGFEVLEFLWTFNMPTDHATHFDSPMFGCRTQLNFWWGGSWPAGGAALL
jgi:acyl-CoA dehydrogenase